MTKRTYWFSLIGALMLGLGIGSVDVSVLADNHRMIWVAGEYPAAYEASMEASSAAFERKDMEGTRAHMAEDFATYELHGPDSPKLLVQGVDETIAAMNMFFSGDFGSTWDGADVEKLGSIGNTMVQIEHDRYKTEDGVQTISTFVIIQYKNGKRWREWRLRPDPAT